ncbi:MAG TPA: replicative DNA helicase, partial [Planctomycetaceae bacterium]|nr:replicative DNA helicase [Planctomycetaceae bacterium]
RRLIHASADIMRRAYDGALPADELLQMAERQVFDIAQAKHVGQAHHVSEVLPLAFDRLHFRSEHSGQSLTGVPTGFIELDELTCGLQNSELVIIAARPSVGKTALALNIAQYVAVEENKGVLIVSLEQSKVELAERLLCSLARFDGHKLRSGRVSSKDIRHLMDTAERLRPAPLFVDDTPGRNMLQIAATARRLKMRNDIRLVIVDYLQLIDADNPRDSRQEQIAQISRRLKLLARELQVPVLALSQLNRASELREDRRPRLADLRESGAIEQDADVVMLLHRTQADQDQSQEQGQRAAEVIEVIVAKQRNGPIGKVKLTFLKNYTRFETYARVPEPSAVPF